MTTSSFQLSKDKIIAISKDHQRYALGGFSFFLGLFFLLSVAFSRQDQALFGSVGAFVKQYFTLFFGTVLAYLFPLLLMYWAVRTIRRKDVAHIFIKLGCLVIFAICLCSLLTLPFYHHPEAQKNALRLGGLVGNFITSDWGLRIPRHIGIIGSVILFSAFLIPSLLISTDLLFYRFFKAFGIWMLEQYRKRRGMKPASALDKARIKPKPVKKPKREGLFKRPTPSRVLSSGAEKETSDKLATKGEDASFIDPLEGIIPEKNQTAALANAKPRVDYKLPPLSLLADPPHVEKLMTEEEINEKSEILENTLADFGIEAKVVQVTEGPVVTLFALQPAPGVKINRIVSLENDLAMVLRAIKVRILAPIPGKAAVGIEVPNRQVQGVYIKDILECSKMQKARSPLAFCLGKTISGDPFVGDLARMPHLLIAGATGSGKSVCLNSIIASFLFRQPPDRIKLIIIDPKRVEMSVYQAIPHLMAPVVCEPRKSAAALAWAVELMEERYRILADLGVRNIDSYNALVLTDKPHKKLMGKEVKYMPHLVIVIDELADLMMIARSEVEEYVIRLAQLSRAVGIHLVIATQRPSVNVITGIIKANFPSRIAFQVSSKVDSRTIIDMNGAETLLGRGDMLFYHAGAPKPVRIQGAFIDENEVESLADYIREQQKALYIKEDFEVKTQEKSEASGGSASGSSGYTEESSDEDLYQQALRLVLESNKASVSLIQRRLKIGYARAGRLMDMMEEEGVVGPYQGSKPRSLLVDPSEELSRRGLKTTEQALSEENDIEEEEE